jgi:hypothetical protein
VPDQAVARNTAKAMGRREISEIARLGAEPGRVTMSLYSWPKMISWMIGKMMMPIGFAGTR